MNKQDPIKGEKQTLITKENYKSLGVYYKDVGSELTEEDIEKIKQAKIAKDLDRHAKYASKIKMRKYNETIAFFDEDYVGYNNVIKPMKAGNPICQIKINSSEDVDNLCRALYIHLANNNDLFTNLFDKVNDELDRRELEKDTKAEITSTT